MKVFAYQKVSNSIDHIQVGNKIEVALGAPFHKTVTATAQQVTADEVVFLFDSCLAEMVWTEIGKWLADVLLPAFPNDIYKQMSQITLPTVGQMFGPDDDDAEWIRQTFEQDDKPQFELMKNDFSRIAEYEGHTEWYWLLNRHKDSATDFALVYYYGYASGSHASDAGGVRPVFTLRRAQLPIINL